MVAWQTDATSCLSYAIGPKLLPPSVLVATPRPIVGECAWRMFAMIVPFRFSTSWAL